MTMPSSFYAATKAIVQIELVSGRERGHLLVLAEIQVGLDLEHQVAIALTKAISFQGLNECPSKGALVNAVHMRVRGGLVILTAREDPELVVAVPLNCRTHSKPARNLFGTH